MHFYIYTLSETSGNTMMDFWCGGDWAVCSFLYQGIWLLNICMFFLGNTACFTIGWNGLHGFFFCVKTKLHQ